MNPPPGYAARPLREGDAESVAELMLAFDRAYLDEPDIPSAADVLSSWARLDLKSDSVGCFDGGGGMAAAGTLYERQAGTLNLDGYVDPGHWGRGLGSALIEWAEEAARGRGLDAVRTATLSVDSAARDLVEARGYRPLRSFYRMMVDLAEPPPPATWPAGVEVDTFRRGEETVLHEVMEAAFADHWGHEPRDLVHWQRTVFDQEWFDPSLVYLVRAGGEPVAAEINAVRFGMGFVDRLGTRPGWRGRGLGRALLLRALRDLYDRGQRRVGLGVDAKNETGATHLYESVGMRVVAQADVYEKHL